MTNKEQELEALLAPTVRALGCEVWGIEYRPRRGSSTLKLYIDSAAGVTIDDCERISGQVSALLDVEDPIIESYRLEVSSPGMDRALFRREQYEASIGERIDVQLAFPFEGRRRIAGQLAGLDGEDVVVRASDDGEEVEEYLLPLDQIQRTRIVPVFETS
jgi:ribosome maturation factor RimP